ncbi:MAG: carbohydrate binding family 9 domain-containing protein [Gemmatimonadetes bacterium]|nr:carbohydrate binding family 9 domain-containing protein [Gemmatimonadota bacterium]
MRSLPAGLVLAAIVTAVPPSGLGAQALDPTRPPDSDARPPNPEAIPRPTTTAVRAVGRIAVDGQLDEAAWSAAELLSGFLQSQPRPGMPASERTVVRVLYDDDYIYVGAICYDTDPSKMFSPGFDQDFDTHNSDVFGVSFDPYLDRKNAFMFATNPSGALFDAQAFDNSRLINRAWEGVVHVRTAAHDSGWTAEFAIPLTTLRFKGSEGEQSWGINFLRRVRRRNEESYWAPMHRYHRVHTMSLAGTIQGLTGLKQGRNLSLKPFALASRGWGSLRPVEQHDLAGDGGVDLKWGVTSRMTLDLTYRTDFSQVEVDEEQVNLTRFSLFFPEKRDFFMENAGVFAFGDVSLQNYRLGSSPRDFSLFYSRRIGLLPNGQPAPMIGGGRVTGTAGGLEIGLLDMQTEADSGAPGENFALARVKKNLGSAQVGAVFINREITSAASTGFNRSYGADLSLRLFDHLFVNTYAAATDEGTGAGDNTIGNVLLAWRDRVLDISGFVKRVGDGFDPGVGFIRRNGVRQAYATLGAHPQPRFASLQELNPFIEGNFVEDRDGVLDTRELSAGLEAEFLSGAQANIGATQTYERLTVPFRVSATATVQPGEYEYREASGGFQSDQSRPFSLGARGSYGSFYDGTKRSGRANLRWLPNHHFSVDASAERNNVRLPATAFNADVFRARFRYAHSTRVFASALVQYNAAGDELSVNARLNYIHAPLSDFFLVFTERRNVETGQLLDRLITAKVTRLLAF